MPASATRRAGAGMAGATPSCAPCSPVTTAVGFTEDARRWSSPCSLKPSTTGASISSSGEADPPHARSGVTIAFVAPDVALRSGVQIHAVGHLQPHAAVQAEVIALKRVADMGPAVEPIGSAWHEERKVL